MTRPPASQKEVYATVLVDIAAENKARDPFDQLKVPSFAYIARRIAKIDPFQLTKAQYGEVIARQKHGGFGRGERPTRPLEVVEMDHTPLDIIAIDGNLKVVIGRVYLTVAIDKFSQCILGFSIDTEKPSYLSVAKCLMHAISFKDYVAERYPEIINTWPCFGIMQRLLVDNGMEFHSTSLEMACAALGISVEYAKVRAPWLKGKVERFFRKTNKDHFQVIPGTTFSNYLQRHGYVSEKYSIATVDNIVRVMHLLVIDIHLQEAHRSLRAKPAYVWYETTVEFPPRMPSSQTALKIALGKEERPRAVWHYGVVLRYVTYAGPGLARIRHWPAVDLLDQVTSPCPRKAVEWITEVSSSRAA